MASVNGVSSAGSTNSFYNNKISGLASGMDTETMIENMTAATRARIAKQKQSKQILQWKTDAMRSISDLLVGFRNKYTSFTSPKTNLLSSSFFSRNLINVISEKNSKYIKATGTSNAASSMSILGVKQMATTTTMNIGSASDKTMETGEIDLSGNTDVGISTIAGNSFTVKYGAGDSEKTYRISFDSSKEYKTMQDVADAINKQFDDNKIYVEASVSANGELTFKEDSGYSGGNGFSIESETGGVLTALGVSTGTKLDGTTTEIKGSAYNAGETANTDSRLEKKASVLDTLAGKSMTLSYNGTTKKITMPSKEDMQKFTSFEDFRKSIQDQVDKAFGKNRITVGADVNATNAMAGKLTFETTEGSSVLKVISGDAGLLGEKGVLGMVSGESNRVNVATSIKNSGLAGAGGLTTTKITVDKLDDKGNKIPKLDTDKKPVLDSDGKPTYETEEVDGYKFSINGVEFQFKEDVNIGDMMNEINRSEAGVTMSYNETSDSFTVKANDSGASGEIDIKDVGGNLAETLFGATSATNPDGTTIYDSTRTKFTKGQDAIITVDFGDGAGSVDIVRSSNTFDIDGLSITVSGKFGYNDDGTLKADAVEDAVTFDAQVDSDKVVDAVKGMIDDYNAIIELVNKELSTKRDRDYAPLTDEQREDMSETEIKNWEEKAKAGMLFNDTDLRNLSSELRRIFSYTDIQALEEAGITISNDYSENGKISFDEDKFRAAVEADPEGISKLFTSEEGEEGATFNGVMTSMEELCKKYAATTGATKGILIERAGNKSSPLSLLQNTYLKQMNELDNLIKTLTTKLNTERTRYNKQFTNLEKYISQMNTQSGWLSQQFSS